MQTLTIKNFKSYQNQLIHGLHPNINIILGSNGQGKSNLFKALSFVLSDRLSLNRTELNNCLHRGMDVIENQDIEIEVILKERQNVNSQPVKICKVWKHDLTEELIINGKTVNRKEYENYIESLRVSYSNPYNIVQQGRINQIVLMDQFELYKLLEEVSGVKKFNKRKDQALMTMKKVKNQKEEIKITLSDLSQKLKSLENRKEEFDYYAIEEKTKKYRIKRHLNEILEATRSNMGKIGEEYNQVFEQLGKLTMKRKIYEQKIAQNQAYLNVAKGKMKFLENQSEKQTEFSKTQMKTQDFKIMQKELKNVIKQIEKLTKVMNKKDKEISDFKNDFLETEKRYENMKLSNQFQKNQKNLNRFFEALEKQIMEEGQNLEKLISERKSLSKQSDDYQKSINEKKSIDKESEYERLESEKKELNLRLEENSKQMAKATWSKNVISMELDSLKEVEAQSFNKIRKVLPLLDFHLLSQIRKQKIKGVYGYFIEFVEIDENLQFAYEIAGIQKLCSLLVEDESACLQVIKLNKNIKGRQINIIQLDYLRKQPLEKKTLPKNKDVRSLINKKWIKVKMLPGCPDFLQEDLDRLIQNTFGKHVLVKDYETGLEVSKEYHLNCITGQKEIIYSDGFLCKLGKNQAYSQTKLDAFIRYQQKRQKMLAQTQEKQKIESKIIQLQNEQLQSYNRKQKIQKQLNSLTPFMNDFHSKKKMLESANHELKEIEARIHKIEESIKNKKENLSKMKDKNKSKEYKLSERQAEKIEGQYNKKRRELNSLLGEVFELQEKLQNLTTDQQSLERKIKEQQESKQNFNFYNMDEIVEGIAERQKQLEEYERDIIDYETGQSELEAQKNRLEIKLSTYQAEEKDILDQLEDIGEIQEDIQELEELSNSMSVSHISGKKKHFHYSAKDKLLFAKFSAMLTTFDDHKKTYSQLEEAETKILQLIKNCEEQAYEYMHKISEQFSEAFSDIFKSIVVKGSTEIRFKKVSEKVKEMIKYKNCMMIRVGFGEFAEDMKKWGDFSGGEKTVIAISIILALQRCEPAPFYVLDEIDSALDSVYVQQIAKLLLRQSQLNQTQYLITSFKQDMLSFPEGWCHHYLVRSQNRVSNISKISRNQAVESLKFIANAR